MPRMGGPTKRRAHAAPHMNFPRRCEGILPGVPCNIDGRARATLPNARRVCTRCHKRAYTHPEGPLRARMEAQA